MSGADFQKQAHKVWNRRATVPITEWLHAKQSPEDVRRLKACGSVVIPACATAALHVLGNHELNSPPVSH